MRPAAPVTKSPLDDGIVAKVAGFVYLGSAASAYAESGSPCPATLAPLLALRAQEEWLLASPRAPHPVHAEGRGSLHVMQITAPSPWRLRCGHSPLNGRRERSGQDVDLSSRLHVLLVPDDDSCGWRDPRGKRQPDVRLGVGVGLPQPCAEQLHVAARAGLLVDAGPGAVPITSWPASINWGTSRLPIAPLAPVTKTRIVSSLSFFWSHLADLAGLSP